MTREEQIEVATATYINGRLRNNVPPEEIEEIRLAYQAGAIYADEHPDNPYKDVIAHMSSNTYRVWKQNLWHDAQEDVLPEIDREVIVLCDDGHGGYKVCFGHRPVESYTGISITNHSEMEEYYPERYEKGGWNIPDVKWWLDCNVPNIEEQK